MFSSGDDKICDASSRRLELPYHRERLRRERDVKNIQSTRRYGRIIFFLEKTRGARFLLSSNNGAA